MEPSALNSAVSILENEISALERSVDSLEAWLWIATAAVVIGVALELWVVICEYRSGLRAWRRASICSPEKPPKRKFALELIGALLVTLGVAGELWLGVLSADRNSELRDKNRLLVGLVRQKAGNAEKDAGEANRAAKGFESQIAGANARMKIAEAHIAGAREGSARANERAANLEEQAARLREANIKAQGDLEIERKKRLQLAVSLLPRRFIDQSRAIAVLKQLSGFNAEFEFPDESEPIATAEQIHFVLSVAGWKVTAATPTRNPTWFQDGVFVIPGRGMGTPKERQMMSDDVLMRLSDDFRETQRAAEILVNELTHSGIEAKEAPGASWIPSKTLVVVVNRDAHSLLDKALIELGEQPMPTRVGGVSISGERLSFGAIPPKSPIIRFPQE